MDREARKALATSLCKQAGCNAKIAEIHFHQLVDHNWHPHPPARFLAWWKSHPASHWTTAVKAYNCTHYIEEYEAEHCLFKGPSA